MLARPIDIAEQSRQLPFRQPHEYLDPGHGWLRAICFYLNAVMKRNVRSCAGFCRWPLPF